jgi:hypothetical protein
MRRILSFSDAQRDEPGENDVAARSDIDRTLGETTAPETRSSNFIRAIPDLAEIK